MTFFIFLILGFTLAMPALFIDITVGSINLGWVIFLFGILLWLLVGLIYGYSYSTRLSDDDQHDKCSSREIRRTLWVEPSIGLARFEIMYKEGDDQKNY